MAHNIPVPIEKVRHIRRPSLQADAYIKCFPDGRVEYKLNLMHVEPGEIYKISVQAIFLRNRRETGLSRQAVFYTNKTTVEGVPPGNFPYTGRSIPSDSAIHGVDDFEPSGGASRVKNI